MGVLAELSEEFMDAGEDGFVAFNFARPAAFGGVLDELLLAWALRCIKWVTHREDMYVGVGLVRVGSWSLAAMR
jgi:hypothetical protein